MSASTGIFKFCFAIICGLLLAVAISPRPALANHGGQGCVFTLNIPTMNMYPLIHRLRGDDDIDGSPANIGAFGQDETRLNGNREPHPVYIVRSLRMRGYAPGAKA